MTIDFVGQIDQFQQAIRARSNSIGPAICEEIYLESINLLKVIEYFRDLETGNMALPFLNGVQAAVIEVAGASSLGLIRPALFSLRAEIDMFFAWLFYKDHPIELQDLEESASNFMLRRAVLDYLTKYYRGFGKKFSILENSKSRQESNPYRLLSAHVHSLNSSSVPTIGNLESLVGDEALNKECVTLQGEVTEYLCDVFLSCYGAQWASLPESIVDAAKKRLNGKQQKVVFS